MMHESFTVDAHPLMHPSRRPHHVHSRMSSRTSDHSDSEAAEHRRAALLEERKKKLQSRVSYIRRAVQRQSQNLSNSTSEHRTRMTHRLALAAQKRRHFLVARERSCASHIAHAKEIAKSHQEKLSEQAANIKANLELRHWEVAKRRQLMLVMPRSQLMDPEACCQDDLNTVERAREDAATTIQLWYRRLIVGPIISLFSKSNLSLENAQKMPFDRLVSKIQHPKLLRVTQLLLARVRKMTFVPLNAAQWKAPARMFLSAFLIATHPAEVFSEEQTTHTSLADSARQSLEAFELWMNGYTASNAADLMETFVRSISQFLELFDAWKSKDTEALADTMIAHWVQLERLWISVREQADGETQWMPNIDAQQKDIVKKLEKLGPRAMDRLAAAQARLNEEFQHLNTDSAPSSPVKESDLHSTASAIPIAARRSISESAATSPQRFPISREVRRDSLASTSSRLNQLDLTPMETEEMTPQLTSPVHATRPLLGGISNLSNIAGVFGAHYNQERLAHELIMDPDFELKPPPRSAMEEQIKSIAKKALFDHLKEQFENGHYEGLITAFVPDIREKFLSMVSSSSKMVSEFKDVLDEAHILQQLKHNAFQLHSFVQWITSKMLLLCAPIRDQAIRDIANMTDLVLAFDKIMEMLDAMLLDLANYRLKSLRPHLKMQAAEYEKEKMSMALSQGRMSLERTKEWLKSSVQSLKGVKSARNPEKINLPEHRVQFDEAYNEALLSLLFGGKLVSEETVPETFAMDTDRLYGFQNEIQAMIIVSALVMVAKNAVPSIRDDDVLLNKLKDLLLILMQDASTTSEHLATQIIATISTRRTLNEEQVSMITTMIPKTLSLKDPLYGLLNRRAMSAIKTHLTIGNFKSESLESGGLGHVVNELKALSLKVVLLASYNKEVCGTWYDSILASLI